MKRLALPLIALIAAGTYTALAQQTEAPAPDSPDYQYQPPLADPAPDGLSEDGTVQEGANLIERGAGMLLRNLMNEIAPEIDSISRDLSNGLATLGPVMSDLSVLVDDIGNYQTPERLENGDIVIRRKPGAPPPPEIGENLRQFGQPDAPMPEGDIIPIDPDQPSIEL